MLENIKKKLSDNACAVESALSAYYSSADMDYSALIEAERYGVLGGGKRIRAFLTLTVARLFGADENAAMPYACAVEMVHASSLVHDDMPCMDNDDMRRGKPSTHKAFGETLALLAGDALLIKAFETALGNPDLSPSVNAVAAHRLASASGDCGMLAGQTVDTACDSGGIKDVKKLIKLHGLKTGRLICASAELGCLAAGLNEDDERYGAVTHYAENIGLAFQIIDDILDFEAGEREPNSFLAFMTADEARAYAKEITESAKSAIFSYDDGTLCELADYLTVREY